MKFNSLFFETSPERISKEYSENPDDFVCSFNIVINGKMRNIITYRNDNKGAGLKHLHRHFAESMRENYRYSQRSFAYQKKRGIYDCLNRHMHSDVFLKADIHSYFESIDYELLSQRVSEKFEGKIPKEYVSMLLKTCFYKGKMPIGYITSPILSDVFLNDLDRKLGKARSYVYTRYADDFIISCSGQGSEEKMERVREQLVGLLEEHKLELNMKKTYIRHLKQTGDAIHLLGVNMVYAKSGQNRITVSDRYLRDICKDLALLQLPDLNQEEKNDMFNSIWGKISFVIYSSKTSSAKLEKMIRIKLSMPELVLSRESLIELVN